MPTNLTLKLEDECSSPRISNLGKFSMAVKNIYLCMLNFQDLISGIESGDKRALARALSVVENEVSGYEELLKSLNPDTHIPVIGITGPPGAGKSSLVNALANRLVEKGHKLAVLAVDPSSPFGTGSILGDRLRMESLYNNAAVFIRSVSSRGSLGGLFTQVIELIEVLRSFDFDYIIVETVGVGQSEVEIAGIADVTMVVLVPESGDDIQALKSGIMEIAGIFVVNKSDREGAERFTSYLNELVEERFGEEQKPAIVNTSVINKTGIDELIAEILRFISSTNQGFNEKKLAILAKKVFQLLLKERMRDFDFNVLINDLRTETNKPGFNLYQYTHKQLKNN